MQHWWKKKVEYRRLLKLVSPTQCKRSQRAAGICSSLTELGTHKVNRVGQTELTSGFTHSHFMMYLNLRTDMMRLYGTVLPLVLPWDVSVVSYCLPQYLPVVSLVALSFPPVGLGISILYYMLLHGNEMFYKYSITD